VGLTTPPCKTIIVTKPSKKEGRPKPTLGCSTEEEEEDSKVHHTNILTTHLSADDQVIITLSKDSLKKLLHQVPKTALTYNLAISTVKTKIFPLKDK
jgi:hypothetical protein